MPKDVHPTRETIALIKSEEKPRSRPVSADGVALQARRASLAAAAAFAERGSDGFLHDFLAREAFAEQRDRTKVASRSPTEDFEDLHDEFAAAPDVSPPLEGTELLKKRGCEIFGLPILHRELLRTALMTPLIPIVRARVDPVWAHERPSSRGSSIRPSSREGSPSSRRPRSRGRPGTVLGRPEPDQSPISVRPVSGAPAVRLSPAPTGHLKASSSHLLLDIFRYHTINIIRMNRQSNCLGREVDTWFMLHRLRTGTGYWKGGSETRDERHNRLQEYWNDFHENPRTVNETSPTLSPSLVRSNGMPAAGVTATAAISGITSISGQSGSPADSPKSNGLLSASPRPLRPGSGLAATFTELDFSWKDRSWRSKCSAGSWNHGMRPEGSARAMKQSRSAPTLAARRDDLTNKPKQPTLTLPSLEATGRTVSQILSRRQRKASGWLPEEKSVDADGFIFEDIDPKLPPIHSKVVPTEPWCDPKSPPSRKAAASSIRRYLRECEENKLVPLLVPFLTGHSSKLCSEGRNPTDADLQAITAMVPSLSRIEMVDLSNCTQLTDRALLPFAQSLSGQAVARSVLKLNLSYCRAGPSTVETLVDLLDDASSLCRLQELNLDGVCIGTRRQQKLCAAIASHSNLKSVHLADIGLSGQIAVRCVDELLTSIVLDDLDLGWNCLSAEVFTVMGSHLLENQTIRRLHLANSAIASKGEIITPIVLFIEMLSQDHTLTELDVSLNRLDFRGAIIIEDALQRHRKLTLLNISNNPLGVLGMRSLLRLLASDNSGLLTFDCQGCSGDADGKSTEKFQFFSATNPTGRYNLKLSNPYHRALLRMLCKTSARFNLDIADTFKDLVCQPGPYVRPTTDANGIWTVPKDGTLSVTFSIEKAMSKVMKGMDIWNFDEFLQRHFSAMRSRPAFRKIVPMHGEWRSIIGLRNEQRVFLSALSKDLKISPEAVQEFCQSDRCMAAEVLWELLPCTEGGPAMRYISMLQTPGLPIYISLMTRMRAFLAFNSENPTGHYKLDLANPTDHAVGDRLLLLDRWEASLADQLGRRDVSQRGNRSRIINEVYQESALPVPSVAEWNMPEFDVFEFDYSSGKRPSPDEKPFDDLTITTLILALQKSLCPQRDQVEVLRTVSHMVCLTALQLRSLVGVYKDPGIRAEIFLVMYYRMLDIQNEKLFRCRLDNSEVVRLKHRIGFVSFFPFIQPEQSVFTYDLRYNDQKIALNLIFQLCAKEGWQNLRDAYYIDEKGIVDDLAMGVPKSWEIFERMPKGGIFSGKYTCSPENRDYRLRRRFLQQFGFWKYNGEYEDVCWWSDLKDAPQDILEFLEFLVVRFPNVDKAFTSIDGPGGNGVISLREFEEAVPEIGCTKFQGPDEKERIRVVFRYLDPDNGGTVSRAEWSVMEQMLKEIKLSIHEFVQFLQRTFGPDLDDAWEFLDADGSGEIDAHEWDDACNEIGYFGPTRPIFAFLDKDDEGTVSLDEFLELSEHQTLPKGFLMGASPAPK